ncbi:MAG: isoleucine--tRNA ligase [Sphaerochaeta sp.]|jgi:isoleucyl-tRNA synthetase|nr:isoleucine--tRNA ligase [Sphaerochaeta sp.]MCH3920651.1 isoleucine--tRNA ligase [Sphaerochaeta sp.]MCI2045163.1 isoleucine--tRNA ligase [Sphaerochaeta sp.]MCI2076169.1 isoleucine--tRNA ligase [Sphaerochaeta sp.]MCI2096740.1 isoleucine--tRNA ligase [Sphaerochaeta sp.]
MFHPVTTKVDFPAMEEGTLAFWKEHEIFHKSIEQRPIDNEFVFYDGPPFATGLPHFGHFVPGTIKDAIPRYQTMKGKRVQRGWGWDCHGVPVEYEMEKTLGIGGYTQVMQYGVAKFNDQCRSIVLRYTEEWKKTVTRMGRWVDFDHGYRTMDPTYMESIWWVFKTLYEKGYIYEGYNILPYSPGLACPLSNFEVALGGYQDVVDQAVTVRFAVDGKKNTYFLAWTTTPWTLPSNLALCFGPDIDYVEVEDASDHNHYILGKARLGAYYTKPEQYRVVEEHKGSYYKGMTYEPLFPYFKDLKKQGAFTCVLGDYVTTTDGCGIVHTASGFGEDDYNVLKDTGIPVVCPVDMECKFTDEVPDYKGRFVKDCDKDIINRLRNEGKLVKRENYLHAYPFCYRTHTPLIYRAMSCWFVNVQKIKKSMLECNEQINWIPAHIKEGRFGKWLEGARDWAISRNRFWGNPIPIWKSDSGKYLEVIGSIADLEAKCGKKVPDLHKQYVDELTWKAPDGSTMRRIPDVLDCWFESGSMPYAQLHYPFENKEYFEKHFPADFINEGLDQTRGWFYSLTVIAAGLFDSPAFRNCVVSGLVLAADGKKMSKSLHNFSDPVKVINTYGADALRFDLMNSAVVHADEVNYSDKGVEEVLKTLLIPLWNAYTFFVTYANIDGYQPGETKFEDLKNPLDRWIISMSEELTDACTKAFDAYDIQAVCSQFIPFIDNLNNWYIRRSRRRFWKSDNDQDKKQAYDTLYRVLMTFCKVTCPIIPFVTEEIYQNLKTDDMPESIHLCSYPLYDAAQRDPLLEEEMALTQKAIALGRTLRASHNLKIRQPLATMYLVDRKEDERNILKGMEDIIAEELNVKQVKLQGDETGLVSYGAKANFKVLGKLLGKHMKEVAGRIEGLSSEAIGEILDGKALHIDYEGGSLDLTKDEIIVQRSEAEGVKVLNEGTVTVGFDTKLTESLMEEGVAREIIHAVQNLRKENGFDVADRINMKYDGTPLVDKVFADFGDYIKGETLCQNVEKANLTCSAIECGENQVKFQLSKA